MTNVPKDIEEWNTLEDMLAVFCNLGMKYMKRPEVMQKLMVRGRDSLIVSLGMLDIIHNILIF